MPEHENCCETQVVRPQKPPPEPKPIESPPILCVPKDNHDHGGALNSKISAKRGCPEIEPCPGAAAIPTENYGAEKGDGDKLPLESAVKNVPSGALGQIPVKPGEDVPFEYWTPLADLTKTRPPVENFSLSRFSPSELREHTEKVSKDFRDHLQVAALAGHNAQCSIPRAYAQADRNQMDNNLRLSTRAGVIHRWETELERTISKLVEEIDFVLEMRRRTMRAKAVLKLVENICRDMIRVRCFRVDTDLVRDQVAEEILKELSLCEEIKDLYVRLLDQIKIQIEDLKSAKQRLEFDWSDKTEAYEVESNCRGLNSRSNTILWKPGATRVPADQSSLSSYEFSIREVISEGQTAVERSSTLAVDVDLMIEKSVKDLRDQADRVDLTLMEQIQLEEQAVRRLEVELNKDLHQLADTESLIDEMREASRNLDGSMKCAQTRLDNRLLRRGAENCRDFPQLGLIEEVKSLSENVTVTLGQMKRLDESTTGLIQSRQNIERELIVKRKSLYVDRERCQLIRTFYPSVQALAGN